MRALLGSVAHDVIHRAHCPVIVIPSDGGRNAAEPAVAASAV
jgi:hypothetical protein